MTVIGIVDDRADDRETLTRMLSVSLEVHPGWQTNDISPLRDKGEYSIWIATNQVAVLILDEQLQQSANEHGVSVDYKGHDVVDVVRQFYPTMPIYVITAYPDDGSLQVRFPKVEAILSRAEFYRHSNDYTERFVRSGAKFIDDNLSTLNSLAELSRKIANGEANQDDREKARAIQFNTFLPLQPLVSQSELVTELVQMAKDLKVLEERIESHLREKSEDALG